MKIGLALGGGGARGAAHIGVMMELERLRIRPQLIVGTSIGGMVGALLAAGLTPQELQTFFQKLGVAQMYGLPGNAPSLTSNHKVEKLLEVTIGRPTFADLTVPLALVAVDLVSRKIVILDEGDVITAVLATIAIPIIMPPVEMDGMVLVDGGLLNNLPFDIVRARGATHVIAVGLANSSPYGTPVEPPPPAGGVIGRALAITQRRRTWQMMTTVADIITTQSLNVRMAASQPDLLLLPSIGTISLFDFHRLEEGVRAGRTAVLEAEDKLKELAAKVNG